MKKLTEKLKNIYSKDLYFYSTLIFIIILLGQIPIILHFFHTKDGYYYPYLDRPSFSDFYYLALVRYGLGSDWLLKIPYVPFPHKASLIQVFFVLLGKVSLFTGIGVAEVFAIFRIIGGVVYAVSAGLLLKLILSKSRARLAFIFFLFAQPLVHFNKAKYLWQDFDVWIWHFGEAARRISTMPPHYTLGKGLAILSLVLIISHFKNKKLSFALASSILAFIAGLVYPPPVFIILFAFFTALAFYLILCKFKVKTILERYKLKGLILVIFSSLLSLFLLKAELAKGHPWSGWNKIELGWNDPSMRFEWGYLNLLGFLVLFVPLSLRKVFRRKKINYINIFVFFWFISSFILFPFANLMKLGKFRLIEGAQIVPMAILSLWGFEYLLELITRHKSYKFSRSVKTIILVFITVNFLIFTVFQAMWSTKRLWGYSTNVYYQPDELAALNFLDKNTKQDSIVMAEWSPSGYIPVFARVRTINGFPDAFENYNEYEYENSIILDILNNKAPERKVIDYLSNRGVSYVYRYRQDYDKIEFYPDIMEKVFKQGGFEIYKVGNNIK